MGLREPRCGRVVLLVLGNVRLLLLIATVLTLQVIVRASSNSDEVPWAVLARHSAARNQKMPKEAKMEMREAARAMFVHGYDSYMMHAFPGGQLDPVECKPTSLEVLNIPIMTLIDATTTLAVMGNATEFRNAVQLIVKHANFAIDVNVSVFEMTIRVVGGLISAHFVAERDPSGPPFRVDADVDNWYGGELLQLAKDVALRLLPAFDTVTGIPYGTVNLLHGVPKDETEISNIATAGTLSLEFSALSALTGDWRFAFAAEGAAKGVWMRRSGLGLVGKHININNGRWTEAVSGIGSNSDSFYEYLIKYYILWGDLQYWDMFFEAYLALLEHVRYGDWYLDVDMMTGDFMSGHFENLMAFWPGLLAHIGDTHGASRSLNAFYLMWRDLMFTPECFDILSWDSACDFSYRLRPELIESTLWQHRATRDDSWLWAGVDFYESIMSHCRTECGFVSVLDLDTLELGTEMPSYFLSETVKYLYLLYDEDNYFLGENYVFNTEAHPLPIREIRSRGSKNRIVAATQSQALAFQDSIRQRLIQLLHLGGRVSSGTEDRIEGQGPYAGAIIVTPDQDQPRDRWRDNRVPEMIRSLRKLWTGQVDRLAYLDYLVAAFFDAVCPKSTFWMSPFGYVESFKHTLSEIGLWNAGMTGGAFYPCHQSDGRMRNASRPETREECRMTTVNPYAFVPGWRLGSFPERKYSSLDVEGLGTFRIHAALDGIQITRTSQSHTIEIKHSGENNSLNSAPLLVLEHELSEGGTERVSRSIYVGERGMLTYCTIATLDKEEEKVYACAPAAFSMAMNPVLPIVEAPLVLAEDLLGCREPNMAIPKVFGPGGRLKQKSYGPYAGKVVILRRGECSFLQKALIAQGAGAEAVIIANNIPSSSVFIMEAEIENNEDDEEQTQLPRQSLSSYIRIPVVMVSYQFGFEILEAAANTRGESDLKLRVDVSSVHQSLMEPMMNLSPHDAQSWLDGVASGMTKASSTSKRLSNPLIDLSPSTLRGMRKPPFNFPQVVTSHEATQVVTHEWSVLISRAPFSGGYKLHIYPGDV